MKKNRIDGKINMHVTNGHESGITSNLLEPLRTAREAKREIFFFTK